MKYYIMVNPHGGMKKGPGLLKKIKPVLENGGAELTIIETMYSGHGRELANQLDFSGYGGFIAIGGDGTLHEVVNGLLARKDGQIIPLGLIPGGSGNSFMHDLDLLDPLKAVKAIVSNKTRMVDVAEVKINHVVKYAINIIGWGLVTDVASKAEKYRWLGTSRYTLLSVIEVFTYNPRPAALILDGKRFSDDFTFIIASNTIHTGKGMKMAPMAKLNDGLLDIIVVRHNASRLKLLSLLPNLFDGSHINSPLVECYSASEFSLIPKQDELLNIDGEIAGSTPIDVRVLKEKVEVFC